MTLSWNFLALFKECMMLPSLMLMLVLPLFAVFSAHACDDMMLFASQMTEKDQTYAGDSEPLTQAEQKGDDGARGSATLGNDGTHITFARPRANVLAGSLATTAGSIGNVSTVTFLTADEMDEAASKLPNYRVVTRM